MPRDPNYAEGILSDVIYVLATGEGDIKERLKEAFLPSAPIFRSDLPDYLVAQWDEIHAALLKPKQGSPFRHAINGNLYRMHKKTAARYAMKLWNLWRMLEEYCSEEDGKVHEVGDDDFCSDSVMKSPFEIFKERLEEETPDESP